MKDQDVSWCVSRLSALTLQDEDVSRDLALLIGGMTSRGEIAEFLTDLMGENKTKGSKVQNFISDCLERFGARDDEVAYRKGKIGDLPTGKKPAKQKTKATFENILMEEQKPTKKKTTKKTQYIKIISDNELTSVLLPGRNICHCLAQRHKLVNNCMMCGRIVCEQEGEGPCMFCGKLVANPENTARIASQSKKGREIERRLTDNKPANFTPLAHYHVPDQTNIQTEAYNRAVAHKEKLLEYDRTEIHRSKVLDDESDYFQNTRWLSKDEKEVVHKKADERADAMHQSRLKSKVTLDFAGRKIVEDTSSALHSEMGVIYDDQVNPDNSVRRLSCDFEPLFIDQPQMPLHQPSQHFNTPKSELNQKKAAIRNQDKAFKLLRDEGMCLTMHQPWASLLVAGIKKIEGRSWYSSHRGRLWIHAAGKQAGTAEIQAVEEQYREIRGHDLEFPEYYPSSAIIGCVFVEDVVPSYENEEENSSEYLFICKDAVALPVPITSKGQHKVWKLGKQEHSTVLDQLF